MNITSSQNLRIKQVIKLRDDKKQRELDKLMLVEGWNEIDLALKAGFLPQTILIAPDLTNRKYDNVSTEIITLSQALFEKVSYRQNPDGWLAVFHTPDKSLQDIKLSPKPLLIVAESIEKPGNLGAILRTADAV